MDLSQFVVANCPATAYYIPNFISEAEEQCILSSVENAPKPKWTQLSHRRLLNYGGVPHPNGMIAEEIPKWLQHFTKKTSDFDIIKAHKPNHVLVNEYLPGSGIMPHLDGPLFYPVIMTISCGSYTILNFYRTNENDTKDIVDSSIHKQCGQTSSSSFALLLEPRSLLILEQELYSRFMHGIADVEEDVITSDIVNLNSLGECHNVGDTLKRKTRISLTIRHVPKTSFLKLKIGSFR